MDARIGFTIVSVLFVAACGANPSDESNVVRERAKGTGGACTGGTKSDAGPGGGGMGSGGGGGTVVGGTGGVVYDSGPAYDSAVGGGGAGGIGGSVGGSGGGGESDAGYEIFCGANACKGYRLWGAIPAHSCCAGAALDKCGVNVTSFASQAVGVPAGCWELAQPGNIDCGCPSFNFPSPIYEGGQSYIGCCTSSGQCGYAVDLGYSSGPNVGCQEASRVDGRSGTCTPGQPTGLPDSGICP
jgi:hypothetical protein